jgi:hypothetical protein
VRTTLVGILLVAVAGCGSSRDYRSINRTSADFIYETYREGRQLRKKNLKQDVAFSQRAPGNKRIRKTSRQFAWETFWEGQWAGWGDMARTAGTEFKEEGARLRSMRFGFLDTGD